VRAAEQQVDHQERPSKPRVSATPSIIQAGDMLKKLREMESKILKLHDSYVNFHHNGLLRTDHMSDEERKRVDQEITVFAIGWTTEVNDLKRNHGTHASQQSAEHFTCIVTFLLDCLQRFTKACQLMRNLHAKYSASPFKLFQHKRSRSLTPIKDNEVIDSKEESSKGKNSRVVLKPATVTDRTDSTSIQNPGFADRYTSEIAAPSKMKEYNSFASKHREALLAESKQMSEKFSDDLQEAMQIEHTITGVFDMLNEFVSVLRTQAEMVEDVHDASKAATAHVQETDEQLLLTVQRSKSFQVTTVAFIVGLAFFLLILDALTP